MVFETSFQRTTHSVTQRRWLTAVLSFFLVATPLVFWRLGAVDVVTMEGIVADGAREMARTGDLWVPRLHGEVYTYKPPLAYWLALVATGGETTTDAWSLRLPFALSGLLMAGVVLMAVGRRLGPVAGWVCAVASVTSILALQKFRLAEFDAPLAAGVGIASTLAMVELTADRPSRWRWPTVYLALALAFLAKGVPALMFFGPGLLIAALWTSSWRRLLSPAHLVGCSLFAAVVGLWLAAAWQGEGWGAFEQPLREANARGLTWSPEALAATLRKPIVLLGVFFPWTLALPLGLRAQVRARWSPRARPLLRAAAGFTLGGLLTLMAVPATETRYLLPLAAPVGVLCGTLLYQAPATGRLRGLRCLTFGLGALIVLLTPWAVTLGHLEVPMTHAWILMGVGALVALAALELHRLPLPPRLRATGAILACVLALWAMQLYASEPHRAHSRSLRGVAAEFEPHLDVSEPLWVGPVSGGFHHSSLLFYLRRPVRTFALDQSPPLDAAVVLFSDEQPMRDGAPSFPHRLLVQEVQRGVRFALVRVRAEGSDHPTEEGSIAGP